MKCPFCGAELNGGDVFCYFCGSNLENGNVFHNQNNYDDNFTRTVPVNQEYNPNQKYFNNQEFNQNQTDFQNQGYYQNPMPLKNQKNKKIPIIVALSIAGAVLIGLLCFLLFSSCSNNKSSSDLNKSSTSPSSYAQNSVSQISGSQSSGSSVEQDDSQKSQSRSGSGSDQSSFNNYKPPQNSNIPPENKDDESYSSENENNDDDSSETNDDLASWKKLYLEAINNNGASGYNLILLNDDDIPELIMGAPDEARGDRIFWVTGDSVQMRAFSYGEKRYGEKSGYLYGKSIRHGVTTEKFYFFNGSELVIQHTGTSSMDADGILNYTFDGDYPRQDEYNKEIDKYSENTPTYFSADYSKDEIIEKIKNY